MEFFPLLVPPCSYQTGEEVACMEEACQGAKARFPPLLKNSQVDASSIMKQRVDEFEQETGT